MLPSLLSLLRLLPLLRLLNYLSYLVFACKLSYAPNRMGSKLITCSIHAKQTPAAVHFSDAEFPVKRIASNELNRSHPSALGFLVIVNEKVVPNVHGIKRETGSNGVFDGIRRLFNNIHRAPSIVNNVLAFESAGVQISLMPRCRVH